MQESRRRSRLEQRLLSLTGLGMVVACASEPPPPRVAVSTPEVPAESAEEAPPAEPPEPKASDSKAAAREAPPTSAETAKTVEPAPPEPPPEAPPAELPKGTLVLHIGDSFAASLGVPLGKRFKAAGVRYILEFETATYVPTWAFGDELPKYIARYNPDFVMITLGANEIEIPNPAQRAGAVKRLIKHLGGRPCVWVLPPLWKEDTGFMQVIRDNAAPCRSLDSTALVGDLPRRRDKIHPNEEGRERWADIVMDWLTRERDPKGERPWSLRAAPERAQAF